METEKWLLILKYTTGYAFQMSYFIFDWAFAFLTCTTRFWLPLILLDVVTWIKLAWTSCVDLMQSRALQENCTGRFTHKHTDTFPWTILQAVEIPSFGLPALGRSAVLCGGSWGTCSCSCWKYGEGSWPCAPLSHITAGLEVCAAKEKSSVFAWWENKKQRTAKRWWGKNGRKLAMYPASEQRGSSYLTRKRYL